MSALMGTALAIAGLALLWIGIAVWLSFLAARRFRLAEAVLESARSTAFLLDAAPARPLLVRPDGRIEIDLRLARELGIEGIPTRLDDLSGETWGLRKGDFERLTVAVASARLSAGRIAEKLRAAGSDRAFDVRGGPAPAPAAPGALLLG